MGQIKLNDAQRDEVNELYLEWEDTIKKTALKAKSSWCAREDMNDLISDAYWVLLRVSGYDEQVGYKAGSSKASFKTYFVSALWNHYRDLGSKGGVRSQNELCIDSYQDLIDNQARSYDISLDSLELYEELYASCSELAQIILRVKWISYPGRVKLTELAQTLQVSYDKILKASSEIQSKAIEIRYNSVPVCNNQRNSPIQNERAKMSDITTAPAPPPPAPPSSEVAPAQMSEVAPAQGSEETMTTETRVTLLDAGFARLMQGAATKNEVLEAIQTVKPGYKGSRASDLVSRLKKKGFINTLPTDDKRVKSYQLVAGAVEALQQSGELTIIVDEEQGVLDYNGKKVRPQLRLRLSDPLATMPAEVPPSPPSGEVASTSAPLQ